MRSTFWIGMVVTLLWSCTTATEEGTGNSSTNKIEAFTVNGKWNSILDLSGADSTDPMIMSLKSVIDQARSEYLFNADGSGQSFLYVADSLDNETTFEWMQHGDTITTSNKFNTNHFIIQHENRMNNLEFVNNEQGIQHYLVR